MARAVRCRKGRAGLGKIAGIPVRRGETGLTEGPGQLSDSSSFIDEVTDELRRERFTKAFRRWGWLGGVLILAIVAGTAWTQ